MSETNEKEISNVRNCEKHGEYECKQVSALGFEFYVMCPGCADEIKRAEEEDQKELLKHRHKKILESRIGKSGVPKRFSGCSFENFIADTKDKQRALQITNAYAVSFDKMLDTAKCMIFTGNVGAGKTHLACAIVNHVIDSGCSALFIAISDLIGGIRATWDKASKKSESDVIQGFIDLDLLIIDEIGVQSESDDERLLMFKVINGRYQEIKPTIIISNLPVNAEGNEPSIRRALGDRIIDRLREGGGRQVIFDWESYRK